MKINFRTIVLILSGLCFYASDIYSWTCPLPSKATGPNPANGATSVSVTTDLGWTAGSGAASHNVYFGTVSPGTFQGNQTGTTFDTGTMSPGVTYYWRIDEKNACGTTTGDVWSFTTVCTTSPGKATGPNPANEATSVSVTTDLSWTAGAGATSHDVYFGTVSPGTFQDNQTGTTFDTGTMSNNTTYYWRIDEKNDCGTTTGGDVWSFTTIQAGEIIEINSDITTNQIWTANNTYYVTDSVNVQALLVIEPGTMVIFGYDCGLFVNNGGTLISKGTPDKPIIYTCDFMYFYYPEDIGYYWWYIYYEYGPYYFSPIYIEETSSPATTVTYSFIEGAVVGIATENITLDHPIENNYLFGNLYGIGEDGTKHTDIRNNLCFFNAVSGIDIYLADINGVADANSHVLIQNNTCDAYQYYGITVHGVPDSNDKGLVMLVNNIVTESYWYGLNLVDGYMMFDVSNTGYGGNGHDSDGGNKNWEFEEYNPVEVNDNPYRHIEGGDYFDIRYLDPNCVFINAGLGYIDETPLIGMTTDINGTPDSNFVDLGFHHPNWNYSNAEQNEPNIIPTISGDPNNGFVDIGVTGWTQDIDNIYLLANGEFVRKIFNFKEGETLTIDISKFGSGEQQFKVVSVDSNSHLTCSNITSAVLPKPLYHCVLPETYEKNQPLPFAAYNPGTEDVSVNVYANGGNLVWSQNFSGNTVLGYIPSEITNQYEFDYVSFTNNSGQSCAIKFTDPIEFPFHSNPLALIVLPDPPIRYAHVDQIAAIQMILRAKGIEYVKLFDKKATFDKVAWYAQNKYIKYLYIDAHGDYRFGLNKLRTSIELYDRTVVSIKRSDFIDPNNAPSWCTDLGISENYFGSFYSMNFSFLKFAFFNACYSGRLKINSNNQLVEDSQDGEDIPQSDMSLALGMGYGIQSHFYQGWFGAFPIGFSYDENEYQKWVRLEWTFLGEDESLYWALYDTILNQTSFNYPEDPVFNYRLRGDGFLDDIYLRNW